jgi:hypothetical protein
MAVLALYKALSTAFLKNETNNFRKKKKEEI